MRARHRRPRAPLPGAPAVVRHLRGARRQPLAHRRPEAARVRLLKGLRIGGWGSLTATSLEGAIQRQGTMASSSGVVLRMDEREEW